MISIILTFLGMYMVGFVIGFINEITNGIFKWIFLLGGIILYIFIGSQIGYGWSLLLFVVVGVMLIRSVFRYIQGFVMGILMMIFGGRRF